MNKHAFAAYGLYVAPRFRPAERALLDDIGGTGHDILTLVHGFLKDLEGRPFRSEKLQEYLGAEAIFPEGCRVRFIANYGKFGLEGDIRDTQSHTTTHSYGTNESAVVAIRNQVLCPPGSTMALFLTERYGGRGAGSFFLRQLQTAFREKFGNDYILHSESLIDNEAWRKYQESAKLTSIKVVRYKPSHDLADTLDPHVIGKFVYEMKPRFGIEGFGTSIKERLFDNKVQAQALLGLAGSEDNDEIRLTLDDGEQSRQVVLGKAQLPALVYLIKYTDVGRAKDDVIYDGMARVVPNLIKQFQLELPSDWETKQWEPARLSVRMEAKREH